MTAGRSRDPSLRLVASEDEPAREAGLTLTPREPTMGDPHDELFTRADLVTALHRPGDHHEGWPVSDPRTVTAVIAQGRSLGVPDDTAVSVTVERRLVIAELEELGLSRLVGILDQQALGTEPRLGLWAATRSYLGLLGGERARSSPEGSPIPAYIGIPARLSDRLIRWWPPTEPLQADELAPALAWERASVSSGMTQGEWALRKATGLAVGESAPRRSARLGDGPGIW
jgi:hypothetical protein